MTQRRVVMLAMLCSACMGDDLLVAKGEVLGAQKPCTLELFLADRNERVRVKRDSVIGKFEQSFVVSPRTNRYYFVLSCEGFQPVKTKAYEAGRGSEPTEIDLGAIALVKKVE